MKLMKFDVDRSLPMGNLLPVVQYIFEQHLNYRCPLDSYESGSYKCAPDVDTDGTETEWTSEQIVSREKIDDTWDSFDYAPTGSNPPTKENPHIIDEYGYWFGDEEQTNQEAPAKAFFDGDILIIEPIDEDLREMNRISTGDVEKSIRLVHPSLKKYITSIQINPYAEVDLSARAEAMGNSIVIYGDQDPTDVSETIDELPYIMNHEAAHLLDISNNRISKSDDYRRAIESDGNDVSDYAAQTHMLSGIGGRVGNAEDFADACALFSSDPETFRDKHPNRAKIIDDLLKKEMS